MLQPRKVLKLQNSSLTSERPETTISFQLRMQFADSILILRGPDV